MKGKNKSVNYREREREGMEERQRERDGGGERGERPQGALFLSAVPAIIYARFRAAWVMGSGYS